MQSTIRQSFYRGQDGVLDRVMSKEELQELREDLNVRNFIVQLMHINYNILRLLK